MTAAAVIGFEYWSPRLYDTKKAAMGSAISSARPGPTGQASSRAPRVSRTGSERTGLASPSGAGPRKYAAQVANMRVVIGTFMPPKTAEKAKSAVPRIHAWRESPDAGRTRGPVALTDRRRGRVRPR